MSWIERKWEAKWKSEMECRKEIEKERDRKGVTGRAKKRGGWKKSEREGK